MSGAMHHTLDDYNFIEIADEAGAPVPDGEPGKILLTGMQKYAYPFLRYEVGDQARIVPGRCPCGRTGRRFEYLGRSDDTIICGLMLLPYGDVVAALYDVGYSQLQVAVRSDPAGDYLVVRLEGDALAPAAGAVHARLLERIPAIARNLREKNIARLVVEIAPPMGLPRNPRTGKVKATVDER
jgi:phenylacetate-CoA ligase